MSDRDCVRFLQRALPRLGYRWAGFRKVRRQVCRRVRRRCAELDLDGFAAYSAFLEAHPEEWQRLDECCRITISRFYRDRQLWRVVERSVLPELYQRALERRPPRVRFWSAGCGAGEEPFTLALLLALGGSPLPVTIQPEIVGTDLDEHQLERACRAVYPESSLRDLPDAWCELAFERRGDGELRLRAPYRESVRFLRQDIRRQAPAGEFDLILCRNLAFTYFDDPTRAAIRQRLFDRLAPHGWLVVGAHELERAQGGPLEAAAGKVPLLRLRRRP